MALTAVQRLDLLKRVRDSGTLEVIVDGRTTRYRSIDEIDRVIASLEGEIAGTAGTATPVRRVIMRLRDPGRVC